jgi:hypothetical protein
MKLHHYRSTRAQIESSSDDGVVEGVQLWGGEAQLPKKFGCGGEVPNLHRFMQ